MNIAIYTNILTPYRKYFYDKLYQYCKKNGDRFHVLVMSESEPNRNWHYNDLKTNYTILLHGKSFSISGAYIHVNYGLERLLTKLKLDYIVCAGSYLCPGVWEVLKYRKKLGYKVYYWSESHLKEDKKNNKIKIIIREFLRAQVYKRFDGFWFAGKLSKQFIKKYASSSADYHFLPNVVDENVFSAAYNNDQSTVLSIKNQYDIDDNKYILLTPARLSPVKGLVEFANVIKQSKYKSSITWLIAGDGELKETLKTIAEKYSIDIRLLGYKNQKEMVELYSIADCFVMPSLSDPNPLTVVEALWAGLPLLLSEHVGNGPEAVVKGNNGYIFSYNYTSEVTSYLETIIVDDNNVWNNNAELKSREIAKRIYNSDLIVEKAVKHFHDNNI